MTRSLSRWLATALLLAGILSPLETRAQVVMSFNDDDPSYPIGSISDEDSPAVSSSASDRVSDTSGCDSGCFVCCDDCYVPRNWISADYLLWWTKGNSIPAMVTSSPPGTAQADAGVLPGATTEFGGEQIANEYRNGIRLNFGHWSDCEGTVGWQATYFSVFDDDQNGDYANGTASALGGGAGLPILGRPFFNSTLGIEDAFLVSYPGLVDGTVNVDTSSEIHSFSWMLRQHWRSGSKGRIDLIGGYRYFRFREGMQIRENLVTTDPVGFAPVGTTFAIEDRFNAENDFHGGDLGITAEFWRCGWSVEVLAKVALGRLRRSSDVYGTTVATPPGGPAVATNGGFLALPTNSGSQHDNDFAALPEFGLNLKYELRRNVSLNFGYTLLMLNDVARTGELIDRVVNPTQLSGGALVGAARPTSQFSNETDFWAQGMNFGVTYSR